MDELFAIDREARKQKLSLEDRIHPGKAILSVGFGR
jgi:hypothetical protein